jgi:sulfide:quinone oxidoreductase
MEHEWRHSIHEFYTIDGAVALAKHLRNWQGGRMVVNVVETPIKCPVAPLEFLMLADWFFQEQGLREKVDITYPPLSRRFHQTGRFTPSGGYLKSKRDQSATRFHGRVCRSGRKKNHLLR